MYFYLLCAYKDLLSYLLWIVLGAMLTIGFSSSVIHCNHIILKAAENFIDVLILLTFTILQESGTISYLLVSQIHSKIFMAKDEIKKYEMPNYQNAM